MELQTFEAIHFCPNRENLLGVIFNEQEYLDALEEAIKRGMSVSLQPSYPLKLKDVIGEVKYYEYDKETQQLLVTASMKEKIPSESEFHPCHFAIRYKRCKAPETSDIVRFESMFLKHPEA